MFNQRGANPFRGMLDLEGKRVHRRTPSSFSFRQAILRTFDGLLQFGPTSLHRRVDLGEQRLLTALLHISQHHLQHRLLKLGSVEHGELTCARFVDPPGTTIFAIPIRLVPLVFGAGIAMDSLTTETAAQ
ncbi:hypothetical protein [Candidatus Chloroploca sp. Khr17]|uniref:hypothetical protein n=1 Tax=Candidatus Chloroploca sp. Khr17 TaxID=2496869 RepID=UPI001F0D4420|nr:hypothetical protein [Candidatus Chloroploca sp. Khr17]